MRVYSGKNLITWILLLIYLGQCSLWKWSFQLLLSKLLIYFWDQQYLKNLRKILIIHRNFIFLRNYLSCKSWSLLKLARNLLFLNVPTKEITFPWIIFLDITENAFYACAIQILSNGQVTSNLVGGALYRQLSRKICGHRFQLISALFISQYSQNISKKR